MTRKEALDRIRVAGYHDDAGTYARVYVENRISLRAARDAYDVGRRQRAGGMRCNCYECRHGGDQ